MRHKSRLAEIGFFLTSLLFEINLDFIYLNRILSLGIFELNEQQKYTFSILFSLKKTEQAYPARKIE